MGDMNGRVGKDNQRIAWCLEKEGEYTKNTHGERIINFCVENKLAISNTKCRHKDIHKITRGEPSRSKKSIMDYFLVNKN